MTTIRRNLAVPFAVAAFLAGCDGSGGDPARSAPATAGGGVAAPDVPAADMPRIEVVATAASGSFTVRWSMPDPIPVADPFRVRIELFEDPACTRPLEGGTCRIDAAMPHHGHGMNVVPRVRPTGPGAWEAVGMLLHMPGRWEIFVDLERDGLLERAQSTVVLP